jgi:hypothetical protein
MTEPCEACVGDGHEFEGIRWPTASDGDASEDYVERCDTCEKYDTDNEAAAALVDLLGDRYVTSGWDRPHGVGDLQPYVEARVQV